MNTKQKIFAGALALLGLGTGSALAEGFQYSGILDANYAKPNGRFVGGSIFGLSGALTTPIDILGANVEGDAGYHDVVVGGSSHSNWNIGGTVFWTFPSGRAGSSVMYHSVEVGGGFADSVWNYHAAGEWFAGKNFTIGAKAGGFSGGWGMGGWYASAEVIGYVHPDVALSATIDYAKDNNWTLFSRETDASVSAEWLVSEETPISVYGGLTWAEANVGWPFGTQNAYIMFVGLRFYTNGSGATTLVDRQRTGTSGWISTFAPFSVNF